MLLLTALDDKGSVPVGSGALIQVGLTGALLADLAIDGRLAVAEDGTVRAGDTRPGDELLADAYDAVREHLQGRNVRQVIGGLSHHIGGSWNRVVDRLTGAGVLGRDRPSLLRQTRHPVLDTAARQAVLDQIRAAAAGEGPVSSQVVVVLALIGPCRLLERVAPDPGTRGEAKRRIDRVTAETRVPPGVATIVDELIVAITVAATTVPPFFVFLAAQADDTLPSVVADVARIGIDHGEEDADVLPVFLHRPVRCHARAESVALVRPAQPVVGGAAVSRPANGEPFALDIEGEQHRPGTSLCSAVGSWNGGQTVAVSAGAAMHKSQHPRPPALSPSHGRPADALISGGRYYDVV